MKVNYFGNPMKFTPKCHRPQPAAYSIEQWTNGKDRQIGTHAVKYDPEHRRRQPVLGHAAEGAVGDGRA